MAVSYGHSVGLRQLRAHAGDIIARVQRGETIDVTEYGRPVARIVPIEQRAHPAILDRLEAEGRLRRPSRPGYLPRRAKSRPGLSLTEQLLAEREESR